MEIILAIATILGGITALWFFWDKIIFWKSGSGEISVHDIELYEKYKSLFIENGAAEFYKQHDFLGSFQEGYWRPLSRYVDNWDTVEHEFVDKELNNAHKNVYSRAFNLGITIANNTVPIGRGSHMRSVKPDYMPLGPTPDRIKEEAQEINNLVPSFTEAHEFFVRLANSKLYKSERGV